jgi:hypothetical protein
MSHQDPRETVVERLMERFGLSEQSDIKMIVGDALDLSCFEEKLPLPASRLFSQFKFLRNPYSNA